MLTTYINIDLSKPISKKLYNILMMKLKMKKLEDYLDFKKFLF